MPDYTHAVISAFLWALSVPIINMGLGCIPKENKFPYIMVGLFFATISGLLTVYLISPINIDLTSAYNNTFTVLAGLLTFPIATGLYYVTSSAYNDKAELASQFAKVKPIISFMFAVIILKETFSNWTFISLLFIVAGAALLLYVSIVKYFSLRAFWLGILTATAWSTGELFVSLGFSDSSATSNFYALLSSAIFMLGVIITMSLFAMRPRFHAKSIIAFSIHGAISFGIAYTLFFHSITTIGLGSTTLITAFWPILALVMTCSVKVVFKKIPCNIPTTTWIASIILLAGSLIAIISTHFQ